MSVNKNAMRRYRILDKCLRNRRRRYTIDDLLEAVNEELQSDGEEISVKKRQLYDDLKFMESDAGFRADIEKVKDGRWTFYRYEDPEFSINNAPITESEAVQLRTALQTLSRFQGAPQFAWVNELIPKLEKITGRLPAEQHIIEYEANQYLKGIELLPDLFHAIQYQKVLSLRYKPFKAETASEVEVHPYFLKQFNNRWFLLGQSLPTNKLAIFALDRIEHFAESGATYRENTETDFSEYFEDIIGVSRPEQGEVATIELVATPSLAPYLVTKPLHPSQKTKPQEDGSILIMLNVIPNFELEALLLSHGDQLRVQKPLSLQSRIKERLAAALAGYHD